MSGDLESSQPANPREAFTFAPFQPGEDPSGDSEVDELRRFVGPNADYYLQRWTPLVQGGDGPGFNGAAFLLAGLWLPYRKMYKVTCLLYGIIFLESILQEVLFAGLNGASESSAGLDLLVGLVAAGICGAFGNRWYLSHARKVIAELRAEGLQGEALSQAISDRGGVNFVSSFGLFFLFMASLFLASMTLNEFLYQRNLVSVLQLNDNDEVYYSGEATEADARALGELLTEYGVFGGPSGVSVQVTASTGTFVVSFVLVDDAWEDPEVLKFYQELGGTLASDRFGAPLTIDLCNEYFEVQESLHIALSDVQEVKLAKLLEEKEQTALRKYEEAQVKADQGDIAAQILYEEAIALWEEVLSQATDPAYRKFAVARLATAYLQLGELQQQLGKRSQAESTLGKAIDYGERAVAAEPERPLLSHNLEVARRLLGGLREQALQEQMTELCSAHRFADAIDLCVRSIEEREKQVGSGKDRDAAVWRLAYRLDQFAWFLAHCPDGRFRDTEAAIKHARRATELQPDAGDYWYTLAMVQYRSGDWRDSLASLDKVKAEQGEFSAVDWLLVAMNRQQLKQRQDARAALRKAIEWLEEQERKAEGNPLLRLQYEMMRSNIEALRQEAVNLIEGEDSAGRRVAKAVRGVEHGRFPVGDLGLTC